MYDVNADVIAGIAQVQHTGAIATNVQERLKKKKDWKKKKKEMGLSFWYHP